MSSTDVNVQLVINEMSKTKYESLLSSNEINDNELYLVKEENIDAYNKPIVNVADPVNATDAVNKQYIDNTLKETIMSSRIVGEIFYTSRLDVLDDGGKVLNGAVPCNGKIWTDSINIDNSILGLLKNGKLPYVSMQEYDNILNAQNGVCHVFGWDGADTVRVPTLNDVFIETSIDGDNISGFIVSSDTEGNTISSFNGYLEAGLPAVFNEDITQIVTDVAVGWGPGPEHHSGSSLNGFSKNAVNLEGNLSSIYGKSDTVQPRAVRYIPMVQFYNNIDESVVINYDNLVEKCNEIIANAQDSVNELKLNSVQAGHMLGEIFYTTRLDVLEDGGKIINGAVPCNGKIIPNIVDLTSGILDLLQNNSLPHTTLENYEKLLETQNGVCHVFGWDGADIVRVPTLNDVFIEASVVEDNISGFTVSTDAEGNMISSFNGYLEAGLPNITGSICNISDGQGKGFTDPSQLSNTVSGAFDVSAYGGWLENEGIENAYGGRMIYFNANKSNQIYGKSDTVQPRAVRYIPMVQFYNTVDESAVTNYDDLVVKYTNIMTDMQNSTNELKEALADADLTSYVKIADINSYIYTPGQLTEISSVSITTTSAQPSTELSTTVTGPCYVYGTTTITPKNYSGGSSTKEDIKVEIYIDNILLQTTMSYVCYTVDHDSGGQNRATMTFTNNACSIFIPANKEATIKTIANASNGTAKVYTM